MKASRTNLIVLTVASFLASVLPILVVVVLRWDAYIGRPSDAVKLSIGGVIVAAIILFKVLGKLHMPHELVLSAMVFILVFLLESIVKDIMLLSGMWLLGLSMEYIFFRYPIKRMREELLVNKTADATAQRIEEIIERKGGIR